MNIIEKLKKMGYSTIDDGFYNYVTMWDSWYKGNVEGFHDYRVYNGQKKVSCRRHSLNMGKKVCEDWANLLLNEKVVITLEGEKEQAFVDAVFEANDFEVNANELQEKGAAHGTYALVLSVENAVADADTGSIIANKDARVVIDYVTAKDGIFPLSWSNRDIKECAFTKAFSTNGKQYVYMKLYVIEGNEYVIKNFLFELTNGSESSLGDMTEDQMHKVKGFEDVPAEIHTGSLDKQFVIGRLNIANNLDENNPLGISVFANAVDVLRGVDVAYDSYVNEFVLGKKRIMVKPAASKDIEGNPYFDANDLTYYVLPEDVTDGDVIKEIDMTLRTSEHSKGLQDQLNVLSSKCGFGENHYQFERGSVKTATEVVSENSSMFRTLKKHERVLESVLKALCRTILRLGNTYMGLSLDEDVEISIDFDDSIIEDKTADFERDMRLLSAGIIADVEFRMKWMNEDEKTARKALPNAQDLTKNTEIVERE